MKKKILFSLFSLGLLLLNHFCYEPSSQAPTSGGYPIKQEDEFKIELEKLIEELKKIENLTKPETENLKLRKEIIDKIVKEIIAKHKHLDPLEENLKKGIDAKILIADKEKLIRLNINDFRGINKEVKKVLDRIDKEGIEKIKDREIGIFSVFLKNKLIEKEIPEIKDENEVILENLPVIKSLPDYIRNSELEKTLQELRISRKRALELKVQNSLDEKSDFFRKLKEKVISYNKSVEKIISIVEELNDFKIEIEQDKKKNDAFLEDKRNNILSQIKFILEKLPENNLEKIEQYFNNIKQAIKNYKKALLDLESDPTYDKINKAEAKLREREKNINAESLREISAISFVFETARNNFNQATLKFRELKEEENKLELRAQVEKFINQFEEKIKELDAILEKLKPELIKYREIKKRFEEIISQRKIDFEKASQLGISNFYNLIFEAEEREINQELNKLRREIFTKFESNQDKISSNYQSTLAKVTKAKNFFNLVGPLLESLIERKIILGANKNSRSTEDLKGVKSLEKIWEDIKNYLDKAINKLKEFRGFKDVNAKTIKGQIENFKSSFDTEDRNFKEFMSIVNDWVKEYKNIKTKFDQMPRDAKTTLHTKAKEWQIENLSGFHSTEFDKAINNLNSKIDTLKKNIYEKKMQNYSLEKNSFEAKVNQGINEINKEIKLAKNTFNEAIDYLNTNQSIAKTARDFAKNLIEDVFKPMKNLFSEMWPEGSQTIDQRYITKRLTVIKTFEKKFGDFQTLEKYKQFISDNISTKWGEEIYQFYLQAKSIFVYRNKVGLNIIHGGLYNFWELMQRIIIEKQKGSDLNRILCYSTDNKLCSGSAPGREIDEKIYTLYNNLEKISVEINKIYNKNISWGNKDDNLWGIYKRLADWQNNGQDKYLND